MAAGGERRGAAARLTAAEVLRLTLERQGLLRRTIGLQPAAAVERFGPLHATDHRTPYLSLLARIEDFVIADLDRAWFVERTLDRRAAMRGTLHLIPAARLADVVCVFGTARPEDHRGLRDARIAPAEAERFRRAVHAVLERGGPLELAALKHSLPPAVRTRATEKTVLGPSVLAAIVRWMTEAGLLSLTAGTEVRGGVPRSGWSRSPQAYERFEPVFGRLPRCVRAGADVRLARWYFEAHGPAAYEDWAWWTGLPASRARSAFVTVRPGLLEARVEGWVEPVYLTPGELETVPAMEDGPVVRLLPYEDGALKAYRATRSRFFDERSGARQQTSFGEILPSVLVDGRVAGTWSHGVGGFAGALDARAGRTARGLSAELFGPADRAVRDRLDAELARIAAALGPVG